MRNFLIWLLEPLNRWGFALLQRQGLVLFCSDAPDMTAQNTIAASQAALSAEQLAWAKEIYAASAPDRAAATARANAVSDAQLESMNTQTALAKDYADYAKTTFRPLETGIVADAAAYDTPERREQAAGEAIAAVGTQAAGARESIAREAMARGVDPNSGNFAMSQGVMGVRTGAAKAGAANAARTQVETLGAAKKMDAASLGRGLASSQATSAGIALSAGDRSTANAQVPLTATSTGAQLMQAGYAGAQQGLGNAASTYGAVANSGATDNSGMWGALGTVAGAFIGGPAGAAAGGAIGRGVASSDVATKENIEPLSPEEALESVEATPVSTYNYKAGTPGAADAGRGQTAGPMAQDVEKTMGAKVAPGGKKIDLIALNGIAMAAIQGLSKKLDRVMAAQGLPA